MILALLAAPLKVTAAEQNGESSDIDSGSDISQFHGVFHGVRRVDVPGEETVEPWGSKRVANEYRFGGNLKGILEAVPYLAELGVGVVYMTPIFLSAHSIRLMGRVFASSASFFSRSST